MDPARILARGTTPKPEAPAPTTGAGMDYVVSRKLKANPDQLTEIQRICRLPISVPLTDEEVEAVSQMHVTPDALAKGFRLKRAQAEAIHTFFELGFVFAPIEVGGGKTAISLRTIAVAFEQGMCHRAALVVPPNVYAQLVEHDIAWVRKRMPLGITFHLLGGKTPERRREMTSSRRGCWILPYSLLSTRDSFELLESIRPDLMFFDEAHNLKNRQSARTKRVLAYWKKYRPIVCAASGTMTSKSLRNYAHILLMCAGQNSPLPLDMGVVDEWATVLDSEQSGEGRHLQHTNTGPLRPLINWSNANFQPPLLHDVPGFRRAFQNRLLTAPGVVSSPPDSLGVSLVIENNPAPPANEQLLKLFKQLNDLWVTPDGDEIEHAMLVWKWKMELTAGFYNSLVWPTDEHIANSLEISVEEAKERLERSRQHHKAQQAYHSELRKWFQSRPHRPGMDTPMLVGNEMSRNGDRNVGSTLYQSWLAKQDLDFDGRIERLSIPVRVCDYKIKEAIQWTGGDRRHDGIFWYYHQEVGIWLFEELQKAGIPSVHCPAGKWSNEFLAKGDVEARCRGKYLVCSLPAHGTGKNLQFMVDQCMVQLPPTEQLMQQAVGRTHRTGQQADEVIVSTMISNETDEMALAAILNDAMYVFETMDSQRKVLIGTWTPKMPTLYASNMLMRAGIQAKILNAKQQQMLLDRFR